MITILSMQFFALLSSSSLTTVEDSQALYEAAMGLIIVATTAYFMGRISGHKEDDSPKME